MPNLLEVPVLAAFCAPHCFDEVTDAVLKLNPFAPDKAELQLQLQMHLHAHAMADEMTVNQQFVHQMIAFVGVELHGTRDQNGRIHIIATIAPGLVNGDSYTEAYVGNA
jgi:hypothetical protein